MTATRLESGVLPTLSGSAVPEHLIPVVGLAALSVLCFLASATLAAAQAALARVTRSGVEDVIEEHPGGEEEGAARYARVLGLTEERRAVTVAVGFVRTVLDMAAAASLTIVLVALLDAWWMVLAGCVLLAMAGLALRNLVNLDHLGRARPVATLRALAPVVSPIFTVLRPLLVLPGRRRADMPLSDVETRAEMVDDLREMVDSVGEAEPFEEEDREMVRSVFELGHTLTREVMVPRTDMITVDAGTSLDDAIALTVRSGYSRVPVTGGADEDVIGVVYAKDMLQRTHRHPAMMYRSVEDVMRPAVFVPEYKPVDDLLREMQAGTVHIALAVDEYGGIAGLVTIEDLLEEIVGEMHDEHDRAEPEIEVVTPAGPDGDLSSLVLRMPARTPVDEAGEAFGLEIEDEDVETVAGLLAKALGRVPIVGAQADALGLHLEAERVEGRRKQLATLLVSLAEPQDETDDESGADLPAAQQVEETR